MPENPEDQNSEPHFDPGIQTENLSFKADELIACDACGRLNPPNRLNCLYCGGELAIETNDAESIKINLRKLELWERGYNLVHVETSIGVTLSTMAHILSMDPDEVSGIVGAGTPLPLARVESAKEAALLQARLGALGVKSLIVSDDELAPDRLPVRLRSVDILDDRIRLHDFNTGAFYDLERIDLALLVSGMITSERVDLLEKKRRGGKTKVLDETSTFSDESVLDIYGRRDKIGFRIHLTGFDFSCLGDNKGLIAGENMRQLIIALKGRAPNPQLINDYAAVRHVISGVWELASRKDSQGLRRSGFGKVEFGSVASTSNLNQFTKFSRLQRHLYEIKG
jgi:hypothetical protein